MYCIFEFLDNNYIRFKREYHVASTHGYCNYKVFTGMYTTNFFTFYLFVKLEVLLLH